MSIKISVGVDEGQVDWELLEQFRNTSRSSAPDFELDAHDAAGWPCPERADDESDAALPTWAW